MTNYERWQFYMRDITSPQTFLDAGFYYMISCALQRRVWMGGNTIDERSVFPNMYVILVAEAGVGKGLTIKPVCRLLRSLSRKPPTNSYGQPEEIEKPVAEKPTIGGMLTAIENKSIDLSSTIQTLEEIKRRQSEAQLKRGGASSTSPAHYSQLLYPTAADCTTFEALVQEHALAVRSIRPNINGKLSTYAYASLYFGIEELGTLFRKDEDKLMNYLLDAYDCGDFRYKTKHQGEDIVTNSSLNIIGGTTYDFIREALMSRMIGQGFTSRALFIAEAAPRFHRFDFEELTEDQHAAWYQLREHLRALSRVYGRVALTPEALAYLRHYFQEVHPKIENSCDVVMLPYYARKKVHIRKICMAMLFAESVDKFTVDLPIVLKGLEWLAVVEERMHKAFKLRTENPLAAATEKLTKLLQNAPEGYYLDYKLLWMALVDSIKDKGDLDKIIEYLTTIGRLEGDNKKGYRWKHLKGNT